MKQLRLAFALLLTALLFGWRAPQPVYAAGYVVNSLLDNTTNDSVCTLREAIQEANNGADTDCPGSPSNADDTITFSVNGTITLGLTLPNIVNASTAGKLTIDGTGQNITISGNNSVRVMIVDSGADLTLRNLTIANGNAGSGGGIANSGTLTVTGSTFSGNSANFGGGIRNFSSGTLTVTGSTFSGNSANFGGGGIANSGALTVTNSTFSGNSATGFGGGLWNNGTLTVTNSTFSGNSASAGGGGIYNDGTATLKNTIVANSTSGGDCVGSLSSASNNNLIEDSTNACGLVNNSNGNILGQDPNLGALTGNPAYFPLNPGSPAMDAGDNATCAAPPVNNQSQNGVTRPQDGDLNGTAVCDIGAYEHSPYLYLYLPYISK
ncbi:MAG: CSLREA domain-containing protein [Anaerolineae bacterium]|nr:CSLREA domain-containing protein [Candidatus Roseilinea sp.]MDW8449581.1 CSLREA domain-containing protein [Anaerolineae bacterium]